ncbi:MAG: transcription termination factor NusA [Pseudomonadota bacterium]
MLSELDKVLEEIRKDKGIDRGVLIGALETALVKAAQNKYGHGLEIEAHYNEALGEIELFQFKTVAEDVKNIAKEISLKEARTIDPDAENGDDIGVKMDTSQFGRIAAQTAKQVIMQNIREAERENVYSDYKDKKSALVTGYVHRFEKGSIIVMLGKHEAVLSAQEQIPGEMFSMRDRVKGYVLDVKKNAKGPQITISRTHPGFLLKLFELEVPEIAEGIVKIHGVAREPGNRAKIAVESFDGKVDPVGACVGNRGSRVQNIVHELHGEKIDIIPWSDDSVDFVRAALAPAEISEIIVDEEGRTMEIIVDESQLSLAIGKKGQNVRLAAKLTNWKIDIRGKASRDENAKEQLRELLQSDKKEELPGEQNSPVDAVTESPAVQEDSGALVNMDDADKEASE